MIIQKIIVHELQKVSGNQNTTLTTSNSLLVVNDESTELIEILLKSYQGDKILHAEFDNSPGRYFPERYDIYKLSAKTDRDFIDFTIDTTGNLETIIKNKILSKGGYILFTEYQVNTVDFIVIFLIRDTEGKLLRRIQNSFEIKRVEYLDTNHLAMACRINQSKIEGGEQNYLSFTRLKQQDVSDYFTDWISVQQLESSTGFTNTLYNIINNIPVPINPNTNQKYTIDEVRNMVYENAKNNAQKNINLRNLSEQIYGNENTILNYVEENNLSIDTEFRFDKKALKRFVQISVARDGINLKYSRGDIDTKVRLSEDNPDIVIIESQSFARALREQIQNNG